MESADQVASRLRAMLGERPSPQLHPQQRVGFELPDYISTQGGAFTLQDAQDALRTHVERLAVGDGMQVAVPSASPSMFDGETPEQAADRRQRAAKNRPPGGQKRRRKQLPWVPPKADPFVLPDGGDPASSAGKRARTGPSGPAVGATALTQAQPKPAEARRLRLRLAPSREMVRLEEHWEYPFIQRFAGFYNAKSVLASGLLELPASVDDAKRALEEAEADLRKEREYAEALTNTIRGYEADLERAREAIDGLVSYRDSVRGVVGAILSYKDAVARIGELDQGLRLAEAWLDGYTRLFLLNKMSGTTQAKVDAMVGGAGPLPFEEVSLPLSLFATAITMAKALQLPEDVERFERAGQDYPVASPEDRRKTILELLEFLTRRLILDGDYLTSGGEGTVSRYFYSGTVDVAAVDRRLGNMFGDDSAPAAGQDLLASGGRGKVDRAYAAAQRRVNDTGDAPERERLMASMEAAEREARVVADVLRRRGQSIPLGKSAYPNVEAMEAWLRDHEESVERPMVRRVEELLKKHEVAERKVEETLQAEERAAARREQARAEAEALFDNAEQLPHSLTAQAAIEGAVTYVREGGIFMQVPARAYMLGGPVAVFAELCALFLYRNIDASMWPDGTCKTRMSVNHEEEVTQRMLGCLLNLAGMFAARGRTLVRKTKG